MLKLAKRLALVALLIAGAGIAASPVRILIVNERLLMCSFRCPSSSCRTRTATGLAALVGPAMGRSQASQIATSRTFAGGKGISRQLFGTEPGPLELAHLLAQRTSEAVS